MNSETWLGILVGIPIGIVTSLFSWSILFHMLAPKIEFSESIAAGEHFRIKMRNAGRGALVEVTVRATLRAYPPAGGNTRLVTIPTDGDFIPVWPSRRKARTDRIIALRSSLISESDRDDLGRVGIPPEAIDDLGLLLGVNPRNALVLTVLATDSRSGTRRALVSQRYHADTLLIGHFEKRTLKVVSNTPADVDPAIQDGE